MLDVMDVNTSITEPTITPEIEEFYTAQVNRLIGLGREDTAAELAADYDRLIAEQDRRSKPSDADRTARATPSLASEREDLYTYRLNELIEEGREDLIAALVAEHARERRRAA
jgi:hypothetical protein